VMVNRDGGVRLVAFQHYVDCFSYHFKGRIRQLPFGKSRGKSSGVQEDVALAQRELQLLCKMQDHFTARPGTASFEKAQVPRGNIRLVGQIELADAPPLAPLAQQIAYPAGGSHRLNHKTVCRVLHSAVTFWGLLSL